MKKLLWSIVIVAITILPNFSLAQETLVLDNLHGFNEQAGNWIVVGDVTMDRNIDIHEKVEEPETKKKRRRRKQKDIPEPRNAITFTEGAGILLNNPDDEKKDNLVTNWEHGDIILDMKIMLPKGSNSGIYLQGRYEVQLFDSWGVKNPRFGDIGGIYRNWEEDPDKMFLGVAPASNPAKAPGLWQNLTIHFKAPRFDQNGMKITNAKFAYVALNGVSIHENVEVPLPTGGPLSKKEVPLGPLMIQGDHGAVAFKDIRIQHQKPSKVELTNLEYRYLKSEIKRGDELDENQLSEPIKTKTIDISELGEDDNYWVVYSGNLQIPEDGQYFLMVGYTGGTKLYVDGEMVNEIFSVDWFGRMAKELFLTKGTHTIKIENMKSAPWRNPRLGFSVSSPGSETKRFNTYESDPTIGNLVSPIFVDVENEPRMLRGFVFFNNGPEKLSHTIGVGTPEGVHFVYNLATGNIIGVWRGDFVNATPMWHNRGNGSFRPNGAVVWTFLDEPLAQLTTMQDPFPIPSLESDLKPKGYTIDPEDGLPIFKYRYHDLEVENKIAPSTDGKTLINELTFSKADLLNHYYKLAEGNIKQLADGSYSVDDNYYVEVLTNQTPKVREFNDKQELLVQVTGGPINYKIIW